MPTTLTEKLMDLTMRLPILRSLWILIMIQAENSKYPDNKAKPFKQRYTDWNEYL